MAGTAQPLPPLQPAEEPGTLDTLLAVAAGATNGQAPQAVIGAAQSSQTPEEAATNAQAIAGFATAAQAAKHFNAESTANQSQMWGQMSNKDKSALRAAGYKPPGQGLFGEIGNIAGQALNTVTNALGAPLRAEQHVERTIIENGGNGNLFNIADWAHWWNETANGQKFIDSGFQQVALQKYGQRTYNLAMKLATGQTEQQIVSSLSANPTQQQQMAREIQSPEVQAATQYLNAGHVSLGRELAAMVVGGMHGQFSQGVYTTPGVTNKGTFQWLSGGLDAMFDWFGDPLVVGGKFAMGDRFSTGARALRYMVKDGGDIQGAYERYGSFRRAVGTLADRVRAIRAGEEGAAYAATEAENKVAAHSNLILRLVQAEADSSEKVLDWFKNERNLGDWIAGDGFYSQGTAKLPTLSRIGVLKLGAKGTLTKALDFAGKPATDVPIGDAIVGAPADMGRLDRIRVGSGRFATHLFRLMPTSRTFNPNGPGALENLRDIASTFLRPADVDRVLQAFATQPSLGARWNVYRSLMESLAQHAGFEKGSDLWDDVMGKYVSDHGRLYSPGNMPDGTPIDGMYINGNLEHAGLGKTHMNEAWLVPSYKEMAAGARKTLVQKSLFGINHPFLDKFMGIWRPLTLARLGFSVRVGGEEAFGFLLRNGPANYLKGIAANLDRYYLTRRAELAVDEDMKKALDEGLVFKGMPAIEAGDHNVVYKMLTRGLTQEEIDNSDNIYRLFVKSARKSVHGAMAATGHAFTPDRYEDAIIKLINGRGLDHDSSFGKFLTASHYDSTEGTVEHYNNLMKVRNKSGKLVNAQLKGDGMFRAYSQSEDLYKLMWQRELHRIATDDWLREAAVPWRSSEEKVQTLADKLLEDPEWKQSVRSIQDSAGRQVGEGPGFITDRAAAEDHAGRIVKMVNHLLYSPRTGTQITLEDEPLGTYLLREGKAPPWYSADDSGKQLAHVRYEDMPSTVAGPEKVAVPESIDVRDLTDKLFQKFVSPQINWISRQPLFIHQYITGRDAYAGWDAWAERQGMSLETRENFIHEHAQNYAVNRTIPYIHNPELRSQFSQVTRNLSPFWFAQEQFFKRWARTFVYSPWAYRQAELISGSLASTGFIHKDPESGAEYFVYPGSAVVTDVLTRALGAFGIKVQMPVQADLIGQVSMLSPGLSQGLTPNFGPLMVAPMDGIRALDPSLTKAINTIEGNASTSTYLSSILPVDSLRLLDAVAPSVFDPSAFASAQMSAMQYLDATGHGVGLPGVTQVGTGTPPNGPGHFQPGDYFMDNNVPMVLQPDGKWVDFAREAQTYLTRVRNWTRILFVTRALYGFSGPASPEDYFDPKGLNAQLTNLMNEMPYQNAVQTFMAEHPDATAITLGQTTTNASGLGPEFNMDGFLPATNSSMAFLDANPQLVQTYPGAASYFIPMPDTGGKFSLSAYQEQLQEGMRQRRTPQDFLDELVYQEAGNDYFAVDNYKNTAIAEGRMSKQQAAELWTQFSEQFLLANPLFAQMYTGIGQVSRSQIMEEVGGALSSGAAPDNQQTADIQVLYNAYVNWSNATGNFGQPNAPASAVTTGYDQDFAQWISQFVREHPDVQPLVQRVIQPQLQTALTDLAAQGQAITI